MQTTRVTYLAIVGINTTLNGFALSEIAGYIPSTDWVISAALLFNLIFIPIAVPWAYRLGEMAEEEYRRNMKMPNKDEAKQAPEDGARMEFGEGIAPRDRTS